MCSGVFSNFVEEDIRMYTSIVMVALAGSSPALVSKTAWERSYTVASRQGSQERKPLAVFIGRGPNGWDSLSKEGELDPAAEKLLAEHYVRVYLDLAKPEGRRLAAAFDMNDGPGVVLSDFSGELQAFRHQGSLSNSDLEQKLRKYADPDRTVVRTETLQSAVVQTSAYPPPYAPAPQYFAPAAPVWGGGFYGGFSGGRGGC
jgi:hypothetical protein